MFKFIFKNSNRIIESKIVRRFPTYTRLSSDLSKTIGSITCPNHNAECRATILAEAVSPNRDWQVINSCCLDYKQAPELVATLQWGSENERTAT